MRVSLSRNVLIFTASIILLTGALAAFLVNRVSAASQFIDFNNTSDLTTYFNPGSSPVFTNQAIGGIGNSGSVQVPLGSSDVWTAKNSYIVGGTGDVYTFSGYFHIVANSGYGDFGISASSSSSSDSYGQPSQGLGVAFHGGGALIRNNGATASNYSWGKDLEMDSWYYVEFQITRIGANTYDVALIIYDSASDGTIGEIFTQQSSAGIVNNSLASATEVYPFIGAGGSRIDAFDNIGLTGATVLPGYPIVSNDSNSDITDSSATISGTVSDDQGSVVTTRGACYSISTNPSITGICIPVGSVGLGSFNVNIANLTPETQYYIQTYATNSNGASYSTESSFITAAGNGTTPTDPTQPGAVIPSVPNTGLKQKSLPIPLI